MGVFAGRPSGYVPYFISYADTQDAYKDIKHFILHSAADFSLLIKSNHIRGQVIILLIPSDWVDTST